MSLMELDQADAEILTIDYCLLTVEKQKAFSIINRCTTTKYSIITCQ
jgi:hypothetical protein